MEDNPPSFSNKNYYQNIFEKSVISISFVISIGVIVGWLFGVKQILTLTDSGASMKFNTALVFLLSATCLTLLNKKGTTIKYLKVALASIMIAIGLLSLFSSFGFNFLNIDNIIVLDTFSIEKPGLMSRATAFCSIFLGIVFSVFSNEDNDLNFFQKSANTIVFTVALIAVISYLLLIPLENRTTIFKTMAIHTSLLFLLISSLLMLKNPHSIYNKLTLGNYVGNKIFRKLIPRVIIVPLVMGNILLILLDINLIDFNFGIISFTLILIILSFTYISSIANELNTTDEKRVEIEKLSIQVGVELANFKETVNKVLIIVKINTEGRVIYANDSFCNVSQYSKKDIYGKEYSMINSNYHDDEFFKEMKQTIKSGNTWSGNIKNKKKDGSFYWIKSNIIPMKNNDNKIIGFMCIDTLINNPEKLTV